MRKLLISKYLLRILVANIVLLGGGGLLLWSLQIAVKRANSLVVQDVLITGRAILIYAPISGQVSGIESTSQGSLVSPEQAVFTVAGLPIDPKSLLGSKLDLNRDKARLMSIQDSLQQLSTTGVSPSIFSQVLQSQTVQNQKSSPSIVEPSEIDLKKSLAGAEIDRLAQKIDTLKKEAKFEEAKYETLKNLSEGGGNSRLDFMPDMSMDEAYQGWQLKLEEIGAAEAEIAIRQAEIFDLENLKGTIKQDALISLNNSKRELERSIQFAQQEIEKAENQSVEVMPKLQGKVLEVLVSEGEVVETNQPLLVVLDCQNLWVDFQINIEELRYLGTDSSAEIELYHNQETLEGVVQSIRQLSIAELENDEETSSESNDSDKDDTSSRLPSRNGGQLSNQAHVRVALKVPPFRQNTYCNIGDLAKVKIVSQRSLIQQWLQYFRL